MQYISAVPTFFTASFVACILNAQLSFSYSFNITCLSLKQSNLPYLSVRFMLLAEERCTGALSVFPLGQGCHRVFPCQFHSTGAPLHEKTNHLYHRVARQAWRLRCVRSAFCEALHHTVSVQFVFIPVWLCYVCLAPFPQVNKPLCVLHAERIKLLS
jgi:hypothetical protein